MELSQNDRDQIDPQGAAERQASEDSSLIAQQLADLNPYVAFKMQTFKELVRNGGWKLGFLVASSAYLGDRGGNRGNQHTGGMENSFQGKISCRAFAQGTGISHPTVSKYLTAWDLAVADGMPIEISTNLLPDQELDLSNITDENGKLIFTPESWKKYFIPPSGNEKDEFIALVNKIKAFLDLDSGLLTAENFRNQKALEYSPDKVKEYGESLITLGKEIIKRCDDSSIGLNHIFVE